MTEAAVAAGARSVARAAVISDLHLTSDDEARMERFLAFARKLPGRVDELLILGDLFEAYVGRKHLGVAGYRPLGARDRRIGGKRRGGHLPAREPRLFVGFLVHEIHGARVAGDEEAFVSGGRRILCVHGDLFCVRDLRYQAMRRKLRSPVLRGVAKALPLPVLLRIAGKLRKTSMGRSP